MDDLTGKRFGRLTVKELNEISTFLGVTSITWKCICDCGKEIIVSKNSLLDGSARSCGCLKKLKRYGSGLPKTINKKLYGVWVNINQRCLNPKNKDYKYYGARGIKVCDEWIADFENFYNWSISNGYKENKHLSIDRIDVNGNYEPSNCKWIPLKEQSKNRRNNVLITYKGETHCISEWARITGLSNKTIRYRLNRQKDNKTIDYEYLFRAV